MTTTIEERTRINLAWSIGDKLGLSTRMKADLMSIEDYTILCTLNAITEAIIRVEKATGTIAARIDELEKERSNV